MAADSASQPKTSKKSLFLSPLDHWGIVAGHSPNDHLAVPGVREFFLDPRIRGVSEAIGRQGAGTDVGLVGALGVLAHDVGRPRMDMQ